jgi:hypothetical protein
MQTFNTAKMSRLTVTGNLIAVKMLNRIFMSWTFAINRFKKCNCENYSDS